MTNKIFIQTVCLIIALLFFFATSTPAAVLAQANEKRTNANSLCMLKLAMACKNGQAALSKEERLAIQEKILAQVENLFNKIEQSGFSEEAIQKYGYILPQVFTEKIMRLSDISKTGMSTEGKVNALAVAFDYSCDDIIYAGVVAYVLNEFGVIPDLGYFGSLLFAAAVLCYVGVI